MNGHATVSRRWDGLSWAFLFAAAITLALLAASIVMPTPAWSDGVSAWGRNDDGELGDGTMTGPAKCIVAPSEHACSKLPLAVGEISEATSVSAGGSHTLALLASGTVLAWGKNSSGQLGDGTTTGSDVPVAVSGLDEVTAISAGTTHSLALLANGTVVAWGENKAGELGNGTSTNSDVPVPVSGLSEVTAISAGDVFSLALLANGTVMAWGTNELGQLGDGEVALSKVPVAVSGLSEVTAISAGFAHSLALLAGGTAKGWGYNAFGQLGDGTSSGPEKCTLGAKEVACSITPVAVSGLTAATAVAAGERHSLALEGGGGIASWGANESGQLGNGTTTASNVPVTVSGVSSASAVAAGGRSGLATLTSGIAVAWGDNSYGQIGDGTTTNRTVPVQVCGLTAVAGISARAAQSFALEPTGPTCPAVGEVSPSSGPAAGGTNVTISGTDIAEATAVDFGAGNAASFMVTSPTSITATSPPGAGTVDVTVTTPSGTSPPSAADQFTYIPGPTVTKVSPPRGAAGGGTSVEITGTKFSGVSAVSFGSSPASSYTVNSESSITAVSPAGTGTVDVTVTTGLGTTPTSSADDFTYAEAPEFGTCVKVAAGHGSYGNAGCTTAGGTKAFEWYSAFGGAKPLVKAHFTTSIKALTEAKLETKSGQPITCKGESSTGEYSGQKAVANVVVTFTGCHLGVSGNCQSTAAPEGEIVTNTLKGVLGVVKVSSEGPVKNKIGLDLSPAEAPSLAELECAGTPVAVRGSIIVEVKANSMLNKVTLKYVQVKGVQKPSQFAGEPLDVLETRFAEGPFAQAGLALTTNLLDEEKLEVNSVV
jgi:alpha-tubulin suppressor-like RCC1 family protein